MLTKAYGDIHFITHTHTHTPTHTPTHTLHNTTQHNTHNKHVRTQHKQHTHTHTHTVEYAWPPVPEGGPQGLNAELLKEELAHHFCVFACCVCACFTVLEYFTVMIQR